MSVIPASVIDKAVLSIVSGESKDSVLARIVALGLSMKQAAKAFDLANAKIAAAADFDIRKEIGLAYARLNSIYSISVASGDLKSSLGAQKEISKLLSLYGHKGEVDFTSSDEVSEAVLSYLAPLGLAPEGSPAQEHARLAAMEIVRLRGAADAR